MSVALPGGEASEAAEYCTIQQLYALLAGLLDVTDTGSWASARGEVVWEEQGAADAARAGDINAIKAVLPQPCNPPQCKVGK